MRLVLSISSRKVEFSTCRNTCSELRRVTADDLLQSLSDVMRDAAAVAVGGVHALQACDNMQCHKQLHLHSRVWQLQTRYSSAGWPVKARMVLSRSTLQVHHNW